MKIAIDTFGCDHGKSGLGSYLTNFLNNIPASFPHKIELFGSEIDRYTYKSSIEKKFNSINVADNLKAEQKWHRRRANQFFQKNEYDLVIFPAAENVIPPKIGTKAIAVMNSIYSLVKETSGHRYKAQLKKGLEKVDLIIAASEYIKEDLIKNGFNKNKIKVVYNGIDHKVFFPSLDLESEFVEISPFAIKRPYFIYGSRLSGEEKKHIQLIQAFNLFKKKTGYPHRLVLAGNDGEYSDKIKEAAYNSEFASDIFITGFFPRESFSKLYAGATACVFPSVNEGVGLPILESMACGIPVLCSNSAALKEVGGDAPIYFNSNNIEEIAQNMQLIVDDVELNKNKVDVCLERANHFNWNETVIQTFDLAEQLFTK